MAWIDPRYEEHQRKTLGWATMGSVWIRHDAYRFAAPGGIEAERLAAVIGRRRKAEEAAKAEAEEREAFERRTAGRCAASWTSSSVNLRPAAPPG